MKNIIIRSGSLRMGGIERVLVEVLQNFNLKKYKIFLFIEDDSAEENIFLKDIPKEIKIYFLKNNNLIEKVKYYRSKKKNIFYKLIFNLYLNIETRTAMKNTLKLIDEIEKEYGEIETFIDYDWGARKYAEKIKIKKKIIWIHNSLPNLLKKENKIKRFGKNLNKYEKIVAICDEMKEEILELYPFLRGRVFRIYNPFNFQRILDLSENKDDLTEKDLKLIQDEYIIAVSRLDLVQKDYSTLIKAYKIAKENGIKEKLYIVGDGPDKNKIKEMIDANNLSMDVILIGHTKNPYVWMKNAEFFVHSSKYEGFGLVLVEAMACDKLVIASNCPVGPKEILEHGNYGFLFDVGDIEKLSNYMLGLSTKIKYKDVDIGEKLKKLKEKLTDFESSKVIKEYEKLI